MSHRRFEKDEAAPARRRRMPRTAPLALAALAVLGAAAPGWAATVGDAVVAIEAARNETAYPGTAATILAIALRGGAEPGPAIGSIAFTPAAEIALAGVLAFETDVLAEVAITVSGPEGARALPSTAVRGPSPATAHEVVVLGLRGETRYEFVIEARAAADGATSVDRTGAYTTPPLPGFVPPIEVPVSVPSRMAPGYTLFSLAGTGVGNLPMLLIVDEAGEVVWYFRSAFLLFLDDVRQRANGNLLFIGAADSCPGEALASHGVLEFDMLGTFVRRWRDCDLGMPVVHHEVYEKDDGNFLTLSAELRKLGIERLVGDLIVEFTPAGDVVNVVAAHDLFPVERRADVFETIFPFWQGEFGLGALDWSHGNAVIEDPRDGTYIVSLRNLDITAKIAPDGTLRWVLAADDPAIPEDDDLPFLTLLGEGAFPSRQHAPELLPDGNLLVYDNGVADRRTRAVEYEIDEDAMTAREVWEWADPDHDPPLLAFFVGDADRTEAGTILICDGGFQDPPPPPGVVTLNRVFTRIVEVTRDSSEKVFEIVVRDRGEDPLSFLGYRAERLSSLYAAP